jgi:putative tryptophan/tyrosine transport system ATP-binding protein
MITIEDIQVSFNKNTPDEIEALKGISIQLKEGQWTYIIGSNGSGKSTLLKILTQELIPDSGSVIFSFGNSTFSSLFSKRIYNYYISSMDFKKSDLSYVDQKTSNNLVPSMTIYENLIFGLRNDGMYPNLRFYKQKKFRTRVVNVLKEFDIGLEKRLNEQVKFLSGGEQQIIVAARIMLSSPKVLLMDEFTSSLDQKWAPFILKKLKKFVLEQNIMVLAVTHDYSQINNIGDRIIMLKSGRIFADKSKDDFDFSTQSILNLFYENRQ